MDRERVVISRYWKTPEITVKVTAADIALSLTLTDFLESVVQEMGNPSLLLTTNQLRTKLQGASEVVLAKAKEATIGVV